MASSAPVSSRLDALQTAIRRLMTAESESKICMETIESAAAIFDITYGGFWLDDESSGTLKLVAASDGDDADLNAEHTPPEDVLREAFESNGVDVRTNSVAEVSTDELLVPVGGYGVLLLGNQAGFADDDKGIAEILATNVEAALNKREREHELRVKNDRLEEFVSIVSHDLRSPLNVADGNLELASQECSNEHFATARNAVDRMGDLVDELLTLAEHGYVVESRTRIDLASLAEQAWETVHAPDATLEVDGTMVVYGEESRLLQVFENLFRNSVEHAGPDVRIRVGPIESIPTTTRASSFDHIEGFYVEDDGPGVARAAQTDVFEAGYSSDSIGLGLAIVHRIVVAHGWEIECREPVQSGARFVIFDGTKAVTPLGRQ